MTSRIWDTLGTSDPNDDVLKDGSLVVLSRDIFLEKEDGKWLINHRDDDQINSTFCDGAF
jgi:hypothetical protein